MEIFLFIILLVLIIILLNKTTSNSSATQNTLEQLKSSIEELKTQLKSNSSNTQLPNEIAKVIQPELIKKEDLKQTVSEEIIPEEVIPEEIPEIEKRKPEVTFQNVAFSKKEEDYFEQKLQVSTKKQTEPKVVVPPRKSWIEKFKEKNPDIEKFIGENLINKIGILILVLGISFFVKFAIDKDWINEPARVGIGILCGAIVMFVAHKLKTNYKAFSSVFVAGAVGVFYLTIGIAFHDYHLFSQTVAFIIMVVITAFSALVSVSYDRKELAVLTLIGGFAVPFMVSTGEGNYKVLFSYLIILNLGMLTIAYFKKWNLVTILAFIFTCLLYSGWFQSVYFEANFPHSGAFFFATVFYVIFSIAIVINNLRNKSQFSKVDYGLFLANTFFYFGMGISIIEIWGIHTKGLFTVVLAFYNFILAFIFYKKYGLDKNAVYLLLGLTLSFVTLAIPIQFDGNRITLFWAVEAVLLFWLAKKSNILTLKFAAIAVQILMLISLAMDWDFYYLGFQDLNLNPILNPIFITGIVSLASLIASSHFFREEKENVFFNFLKIENRNYRFGLMMVSVFVAYFVGYFEISYQAHSYIENDASAMSLSVLYHFLFSAVLIYFLLKEKVAVQFSFALAFANLILYCALFYNLTFREMTANFAENSSVQIAYIIHYLVLACLFYFIYILYTNRNEPIYSNFLNHKLSLWVLAFFAVYILSNEVMIHGLKLSGDIANNADFLRDKNEIDKGISSKIYYFEGKASLLKTQIIKIGYPVLWGVLSFLFLIVGIKKQNKKLRIIALALLGITIMKLFIYDIQNVSETGKIIAFILLGVLILIISFVYQKIKKLVVDDENIKKVELENIKDNEDEA